MIYLKNVNELLEAIVHEMGLLPEDKEKGLYLPFRRSNLSERVMVFEDGSPLSFPLKEMNIVNDENVVIVDYWDIKHLRQKPYHLISPARLIEDLVEIRQVDLSSTPTLFYFDLAANEEIPLIDPVPLSDNFTNDIFERLSCYYGNKPSEELVYHIRNELIEIPLRKNFIHVVSLEEVYLTVEEDMSIFEARYESQLIRKKVNMHAVESRNIRDIHRAF